MKWPPLAALFVVTLSILLPRVHAAEGTRRAPVLRALPDAFTPNELRALAPPGSSASEVDRLVARHRHTSHPERRVLSAVDPGTGEPTNYGGASNLLHQRIEVAPNLETGFLTVSLEVQFESNLDPLKEVKWRLPEVFDVLSVVDEEGNVLEANHIEKDLLIPLSKPLAKGHQLTLFLEAEGTLDCTRVYLKPCSFGEAMAYVGHARYYVRNEPDLVDLFGARLEVSVPQDKVVGATGRFVGSWANDERPGENVFAFDHEQEGHLVSFAVSKYVAESETVEGIEFSSYLVPGHSARGPELRGFLADVVAYYTERFGPFPYTNLDLIEVYKDFGGGYAPQATLMVASPTFSRSYMANSPAAVTQLLSHEVAHQWWGNLVTMGDSYSVTVSEGLAEFSSALHFLEVEGSVSNFVGNSQTYMYTVPASEDEALVSADLFFNPHYHEIAYEKASVVFDMLRHEMGDTAFFAGLQAYAERYAYGAAGIYELFAEFQRSSGLDLDWFLNQWFHRLGYPLLELRVQQTPVADGIDLQVEALQRGREPFAFTLPLWVVLEGDDDPAALEPQWVEGPSTRWSISLPSRARSIIPDPSQRLMVHTVAAEPADVNLSGGVTGSDLIDLVANLHHNVSVATETGFSFFANERYAPRFDLDGDGRIGEQDVSVVIEAITRAR